MVQANHTAVGLVSLSEDFGFEMGSCFWKRNVGIQEVFSVETLSRHMTACVVYVIEYTKCI
jgi:hypothetical protein